MVKIGFIVEGGTEKILVESPKFNTWLSSLELEAVRPIIDAGGGGNLLPQNIEPLLARLRDAEAEHVIILTDLERESTEQAVKDRIGTRHTQLIFIAVKAIEAWFLADSAAMSAWLRVDTFHEVEPEKTPDLPWFRLKQIAADLGKAGPGASKIAFAKRMVNHYGFDLPHAAEHPACPSAKALQTGLAELNKKLLQ